MAILLDEPEGERFKDLIATGPAMISAGTMLELTAVLVRRFPALSAREPEAIEHTLGLTVVPVTAEQLRIAQAAYRAYGKGTQHPARLNFGDCFAYALAKATGQPLLFKGDDFIHTDIAAA